MSVIKIEIQFLLYIVCMQLYEYDGYDDDDDDDDEYDDGTVVPRR